MYTKQDQGTLSRNFVRQMAKQFESISSVDSTSYVSAHEANFKQCNWWLDMPSSIACFDDLTNDSQPQIENICTADYDIAGEISVHDQDVETAEIANEFHNTAEPPDHDESNATFFRRLDEILGFPTKKSPEPSEETLKTE